MNTANSQKIGRNAPVLLVEREVQEQDRNGHVASKDREVGHDMQPAMRVRPGPAVPALRKIGRVKQHREEGHDSP